MNAQKGAAAEEMMDELEDGMMGGGATTSNPSNKKNEASIREQQLAAIHANVAAGRVDDGIPLISSEDQSNS